MIAVRMIISPYVNLKNNLTAEGWIQQNILIEFLPLCLFSFPHFLSSSLKKVFIENIECWVNKYK